MALIAFPAYGEIMTREFSETPSDNSYRTEMENGYAKQARRSQTNLVQMTIKYLFSAAEYATFKTWYFDTAAAGTSFFDWASPVDDVVRDTRIVKGTMTAVPVNPHMTHYYVSMTFEHYQ